MPTATKKRLPIPVLRTTRRRLVCRGPGESSHWQWHFCPQENAFSHLVLLAGPLVLAHWVLPAPWPEAVTAPLPGIWMQVPVATPLAVPARSQAVAHGT